MSMFGRAGSVLRRSRLSFATYVLAVILYTTSLKGPQVLRQLVSGLLSAI